METINYFPEMNEAKPAAEMEARMDYDGKWTVKTPTKLAKGRGITFVKTYESKDLVKKAQHKVGWHEYRMTARAFKNFKGTASVECLI